MKKYISFLFFIFVFIAGFAVRSQIALADSSGRPGPSFWFDVTSGTCGNISISWQEGTGATGYNVYVATSNGSFTPTFSQARQITNPSAPDAPFYNVSASSMYGVPVWTYNYANGDSADMNGTATNKWDYYWIQSVGSSDSTPVSAGGAINAGDCQLTMSGATTVPWNTSATITYANSLNLNSCQLGGAWSGSLTPTSDINSSLQIQTPVITSQTPAYYSITCTGNDELSVPRSVTTGLWINSTLPCQMTLYTTDNGVSNIPPTDYYFTLNGPVATLSGNGYQDTSYLGFTFGGPSNVTPGNYIAIYNLGGSPHVFSSVTPSASQNCAPGSSVSFTFNFMPPGRGGGSGVVLPGARYVRAQNTSMAPSVPCNEVKVDWDPDFVSVPGYPILSFNIYRSLNPGSPTLIASIPWGTFAYLDSPPTGSSYYYWVSQVFPQGESVPTGPSQVAPTPCQVDFSNSNKTFIFIQPGGTGSFIAFSNAKTIRQGDVVEAQIILPNNGNLDAKNVNFTDTFTNLTSFNSFKLNGAPWMVTPPPAGVTSGTINFPTINKIAAGAVDTITFNATVMASAGSLPGMYRMRNEGAFTFSTALPPDLAGCVGTGNTSSGNLTNPCRVDTGFYVFTIGNIQSPTQHEVAP